MALRRSPASANIGVMVCCTLRVLISAAGVLLYGSVAVAQGVGGPVRQDSGPLRELSTNAGDGGRSVREGSGGLRDSNAGRLSGNSVRGSVTGDVVSGPVGEVSGGPVTSGFRSAGRRTVTDISAGAVTKDIDSPLREVVGAPVRSLGPLQEQLREIQPLPRDVSIPVEPGPDPGEDLPNESADVDQAQLSEFPEQPQYDLEGEPEATQAATEPAEPGEQEPGEEPGSREAE